MHFLIFAVAAFAAFLFPTAAEAQPHPYERGLAITDSEILAKLERKGFSLTSMLSKDWQKGTGTVGNNGQLSSMPELEPVLTRIKFHIEKTRRANPGSGVGMIFDHFRIFDQNYLSSPTARFALVGIVQRLDRAYKQEETCGEVRLIYRLEYKRNTTQGVALSRLPMSFNLVLKAKSENEPAGQKPCQQIAARWKASGQSKRKGDELVNELLSTNGPLSTVSPDLIDRIETNMQILRRPSGSLSEFGGHAEYLLKVFNWHAASRKFLETRMENAIDRDRLLSDPALLTRFKTWIKDPANVRKIDDGTILIPNDFLDATATSFAPGGLARSGNRPFFNLFSDAELTEAIRLADQPAGTLKTIKSPAGFQMRLNDVTCTGCHQSRAIGGFHFMGTDTAASKKHLPENAIFVPASAHFYGEIPRRQRILNAIAAGVTPDYRRGFSLRPSLEQAGTSNIDKQAINLVGTGHFDGWGAACYSHPNKDKSFRDWTCAKKFKCVMPHDNPKDPGHGTCMTATKLSTGDVAEQGRIDSQSFKKDRYTRLKPTPGLPLKAPNLPLAQIYSAAPQAGGFFGGMVYKTKCTTPFPSSTICARHAVGGFNSCLAGASNFKTCFERVSTSGGVSQTVAEVGLRECDITAPCRDDYMCIATRNKSSGACLPPYFMMQFRVDGHPK